ncbi:hypothetical protein [Enterococcus sp. 5H]|nr:hypothetical protein [Enterococcus sp. 5H]MDA9472671.1 hypothetical protein [Enterococcus sp. 5H]
MGFFIQKIIIVIGILVLLSGIRNLLKKDEPEEKDHHDDSWDEF